MNIDSLLQPMGLKDRIRYLTYRRRFNLHPSFRFNGGGTVFSGEGDISAEQGAYIGSFSIISTTKGNHVRIGKNCRISHRISIYTSSTRVRPYLDGIDEKKYGDVVFGDGCWIGVNAYIGPNVVLPPRSIIPANSVVTRSPEPYEVPSTLEKYRNSVMMGEKATPVILR
jgi:maltose O-acetyltransferase